MASADALNWSSVIWTSSAKRIIFVSDGFGQKRIFEPSEFVAGSIEPPYDCPNAIGDRHSLPFKQLLLLEHTDFVPVTQVFARNWVAVEGAHHPWAPPQSAFVEQPHVPWSRVTTMLFSTCRWSPKVVMISPSFLRPRLPLLSQVLLRRFTLSDLKTAIQVP